MSQLGVGIIGAGIMGRVHAEILADHPATRVVAVTSRTRASAEKLAGDHGARVHPDPAALVADPDVDIVVVATPDHLHAAMVCAAAEAGKNVLVEKPFTTDPAEADQAVAAVRRAGVKAMTLFNHRWVPAYAQAQARIAAGDIGRPRLAYARKNDTRHVPIRMIPWAEGTTCAWFLSSHDIDLVCWMFDDEVETVYASAVDGVLRGLGVDTPDAIQAQCRFRGGGVATFESCWTYPDTFPTMTDSFVEIVGERGVIHLDRKCEQIEIATEDAYQYPRNLLVRTVHGVPAGAVRDAIWHLVDAVRHDREPLVTLESSRHVTAVLTAVHRSIASGRPEVV
ncbi:gfo/Idh/MocA family oxidoreductase [Micromonospora sp. S4605]|uniref:Gfo/Idh/MocA family protein n=1 Tax=Micromonospora sp. S4605 TaxID=1420897 RepID=UPI000D6FF50A|nr:Gfo/Idh/MocA family oxidoreductase [Micromonospora sp. S4605]PWU45073.1 gfo/Idh/MocA family oxidoreductase [Micromonospora sp. S4605]